MCTACVCVCVGTPNTFKKWFQLSNKKWQVKIKKLTNEQNINKSPLVRENLNITLGSWLKNNFVLLFRGIFITSSPIPEFFIVHWFQNKSFSLSVSYRIWLFTSWAISQITKKLSTEEAINNQKKLLLWLKIQRNKIITLSSDCKKIINRMFLRQSFYSAITVYSI